MPEPETAAEPQVELSAQRRRRGLLLGTILTILVGLVALGYVYFFIAPDLPLQATLDRLDRDEPEGWRFEDLQKKRVRLEDAENSALVVIQAVQKLPPKWRNNSYFQFDKPQESLSINTLIPGPPFAYLVGEMKNAERARNIAKRLADMPEGQFPIDWKADSYSALSPVIESMSTVAGLLEYDARYKAQLGDGDGALRACQGIVNVGRSTGDEPSILCLMARQGSVNVSVRTVERTLAVTQPSDSSLERIQRILERENDHWGLAAALRGERAMLDNALQGKRVGWINLNASLKGWGHSWKQDVPRLVIESRIAMLDFLADAIEAAKLPPEHQRPAFAALESKAEKLPDLARQWMKVYSNASGHFGDHGRLDHSHRSTLQGYAHCRAGILVLASERFRKKHDRWPTTAQEIVDTDFLRTIPLDPFDAKPIRIAKTPEGLIVYSVGSNGVDDGGGVGDVALRLWDVSRRRQSSPAKTPAASTDQPKN